MKSKTNLLTINSTAASIAVALFTLNIASAADLSIVTEIPTENLLIERGDGAFLGTAPIQQTFGFRNDDAAGTEGTRGRGQSFVITDAGGPSYAISSLTVSLGASGDDAGYRPDGQLAFTVFELDGDTADDFENWSAGTGGTSGSELFAGSFPIASDLLLPATDFLEITFDEDELTLEDGKAYGFFFLYTLNELLDADMNALNEDVTIAFDSDNGAPDNAAGALLSTLPATEFADAVNGVSASRDLNYFITGTAVEDEFAITNFSYDPATNMVTLEWESVPGETFTLQFSDDLAFDDDDGDLDDGVPANPEGETTQATYDLSQSGNQNETRLYFRVLKEAPNAQ